RIRAIYKTEQHLLVVLVDDADPAKGGPDGRVDADYRYDGVEGAWPLGERWEGRAVIEDYFSVSVGPGMGAVGPGAIGITTDKGLVQIFPGAGPLERETLFADRRAIGTVRFAGSGHGGGSGRDTFDQAEARILEAASRQAEMRDRARQS